MIYIRKGEIARGASSTMSSSTVSLTHDDKYKYTADGVIGKQTYRFNLRIVFPQLAYRTAFACPKLGII